MNLKKTKNRIQLYLTWLQNGLPGISLDDQETGISIRMIHTMTGIPLPVIRKDFLCMLQWSVNLSSIYANQHRNELRLPYSLYINDDCQEYYGLDIDYCISSKFDLLWEMPNLTNAPDSFYQLLKNGILDNLPFFAEAPVEPANHHLLINAEEASILPTLHMADTKLKKHYRKLNTTYKTYLTVKESYLYTHDYEMLYETLMLLNLAIDSRTSCMIRYGFPFQESEEIILMPLYISYDSTEHLYAVVGLQDTTITVLRLDKILAIREHQNRISLTEYSAIKQHIEYIAPNVWGNCFSHTPEYVKVCFFNEGNVWNKVRKQLANRKNGSLYEKDGFLYYEDTVYGISKFRSWIMGYGSSALVLWPLSLREHIIQSLQNRQADIH